MLHELLHGLGQAAPRSDPSRRVMFSPPREHVFQNKCPRADENTVSNSGDLCELQMVLSPRREHHLNV